MPGHYYQIVHSNEVAKIHWALLIDTKIYVACALYQVLCFEEVGNAHMHTIFLWIQFESDAVYKRWARDPNNRMYALHCKLYLYCVLEVVLYALSFVVCS